MKYFVISVLFAMNLNVLAAQVDTVLKQKYIIENDLLNNKKIVFQRIQQQYLTNENQYVLDLKIDTSYLILTQNKQNPLEVFG